MFVTINRVFAAASVFASLLLAGVAAAQTQVVVQQPAGPPTARVGMITTLTGGGKGLGIDVRDGFLLAVETNRNAILEVIVEDDERSVEKAQEIVTNMRRRGDIDFYTGIIWSNLLMAVGPEIFEGGNIYVSPNAGPSALAGERCHPNYFNVAWQNDNLHEAVGAILGGQGYRRPFIMAPDYSAGRDALTGFKRFFDGDGLAGEIYTELGQKDYSKEIAEIAASDADSVYFFLPGGMGVNFLKQYREAGGEKDLFGPAFSFDQTILSVTGDAALGVLNSSQWNQDIDYPANEIFVADFQAKYGRLPSLYASQGYDAANMLIEALAQVGDPKDTEGMRRVMMSNDFGSTRGPFRFAANQHPIQDIMIRKVVKVDGVLTNKFLRYGIGDRANAYVDACPYANTQ